MCGLVGLLSKSINGMSNTQTEVFSTLLFLDQLRGDDSTGAFCVTLEGDVHLAKEASDATRFINKPEYLTLARKAYTSGAALIGHNRKATRGTINDENAHPFVVDDNIVLVHNGGVFGDHKKLKDTEVDSHAIAHVIHEEGDVTKAMNKIDAAYALIWYDFKGETINLIRNKHRPLWWVEVSDSWLICSEKAMLDFVNSA